MVVECQAGALCNDSWFRSQKAFCQMPSTCSSLPDVFPYLDQCHHPNYLKKVWCFLRAKNIIFLFIIAQKLVKCAIFSRHIIYHNIYWFIDEWDNKIYVSPNIAEVLVQPTSFTTSWNVTISITPFIFSVSIF